MARLTSRPSLVSSRYPSAAPDTHHDQENMDPDGPRRSKGKQRASHAPTLPTPPSRDDQSYEVRGQKRKRAANAAAAVTDAEHDKDDEEFTRYFDPNQNPDERRETKRRFRELEREYLENREELTHDSGQRLTETVKQADQIFKDVKQTSDACPDSRLLVNVGDLANKRSATLVSDDASIGIDVDEFLSKALAYMRNGAERPQASQRCVDAHDSDDEEEALPIDWDFLGRHACYPYNARPPVPSFLLGPLSLEKKQRAPTQRRARQEKDNLRESRPEALTGQDLSQSDRNSLTTQCKEIRQQLKARVKRATQVLTESGIMTEDDAATARGKELLDKVGLRHVDGLPGVPLFKYVINPNSFGQTVENLFYVSFLIKEGGAGLGLDDDGLPVLHLANAHSIEDQRAQNIRKHQAVLSLDYKTWKDLIQAYKIEEAMIPHREESQSLQIGSRGWYS